ncbi:SIMPL domain-containing protein [Pseudorhodobacter aquimaris]|uniref:SIMPL domain-containing protein n=1 Tax=Pseudorhodobacter aquimaris TaxID=687412 RepID=UPI00067B6504|nr:SIMPL domain-containing protein [Pseudorhodobacter aquimaris]
MRTHNILTFAALLAFAVPAVSAPLCAQEISAGHMAQISVTGEGVVMAAPDMATVTLGVTSSDKTAKLAMDANSAALAEVLKDLKAAGIKSADIQTSGLSLQPEWDSNSAGNGRTIGGYTARNRLTVQVRALDNLGAVLDAAVKDGANTLDGVEFGVAEPGPLLDAARVRAVGNARKRAEVITSAAGVRLGQISSITEGGGDYQPPRGAMFARAEMDSVPVEAGQISFAINVNISWHLAQ